MTDFGNERACRMALYESTMNMYGAPLPYLAINSSRAPCRVLVMKDTCRISVRGSTINMYGAPLQYVHLICV